MYRKGRYSGTERSGILWIKISLYSCLTWLVNSLTALASRSVASGMDGIYSFAVLLLELSLACRRHHYP